MVHEELRGYLFLNKYECNVKIRNWRTLLQRRHRQTLCVHSPGGSTFLHAWNGVMATILKVWRQIRTFPPTISPRSDLKRRSL